VPPLLVSIATTLANSTQPQHWQKGQQEKPRRKAHKG
jgi:hypothetical protein